jgi:chloride channel protein, CIC family
MEASPNPPASPVSIMRSRQFVVLLVLAAVVGVIASLVAWGFLEGINELQEGVYTDLPDALGFDSTPDWWGLPWLLVAGVIVGFAIARMPGAGGHLPARGLNPAPTQPIELPSVLLAALAGISLGAVLGPEAPLIALGGGLGFFVIRRLRSDAPEEIATLVAACGTFAAVSFLFGSPLIAAVLLIEAGGLGGPRLPLVLLPGLLAAGIGSLVSIGLGAWTGVSTAAIAISPLKLPDFPRPDVADFLWTIPFAVAIAVVTVVIFRLAVASERLVRPRPLVAVPLVGLVIGVLALVFAAITDHGIDQVLFSGQESIGPLVSHADAWTTGALVALIGFKGIGYALSLGSFRGGPTFPAMLLGTAGALIVADLPGYDLTPAVAVGLGAAVVAVLRLPLSAIVLATVLTANAGLGSSPLIILGTVVAYLTATAIDPRDPPAAPGAAEPQTAPITQSG